MKTSSELAKIFNQKCSLKIAERRIRHFSNNGWILASDEKRDGRGTEQFCLSEACIAMVLSHLVDIGFDGQGRLKPVSEGMREDAKIVSDLNYWELVINWTKDLKLKVYVDVVPANYILNNSTGFLRIPGSDLCRPVILAYKESSRVITD